ncbi:MAG: outer membrane beta-barrel protein [Ferruginibacter sp.]|nr:outer membrane beta-barrel protein [Ferruginibacter sp.]
MKKILLFVGIATFTLSSFAQEPTKTDTTVVKADTIIVYKNDTTRIGKILIIKKHKKNYGDSVSIITDSSSMIVKKKSKITTNFIVFDLGFANWIDKTNYATAGSYVVTKAGTPAFSADDMRLRAGKSVNVNIWFFMQKIALIKNNVNLKYGLGVELQNYSFRSPISFKEDGIIPYSGGAITNSPFIFRDSITFTKNKLATKYLTIPVMLNFAANNKTSKRGFGASVGVSFGYLYKQRNKQKSSLYGKQRNQGDYNLQKFKFSYTAEAGLGSFRLFGSYTPKSIFENSLDIRPYNIGLRFSNW